MNKQSNIYTIVYIIIAVVVVGSALALTAMSLRDKQQANADADKMKQILSAVRIPTDSGDVKEIFNKAVTEQLLVNSLGEVTYESQAGDMTVFNVSVADQVGVAAAERQLPVYVCDVKGATKYILPVYGAGLWGAIWGYVALDGDGSTIYGAYFSHAGETPGLGAEIEKDYFSDRFVSKQLWKDGQFYPVAVVKAGQRPADNADYVDGISGGTVTSKGVSAMLADCLTPYKAFLENLSKQ